MVREAPSPLPRRHNVPMAKIYTSMTSALRDHWSSHGNTYPQKFILTKPTLTALNQLRDLVNSTMANRVRPGWELEFLGVPIEVSSEGNAMMATDGSLVPLES